MAFVQLLFNAKTCSSKTFRSQTLSRVHRVLLDSGTCFHHYRSKSTGELHCYDRLANFVLCLMCLIDLCSGHAGASSESIGVQNVQRPQLGRNWIRLWKASWCPNMSWRYATSTQIRRSSLSLRTLLLQSSGQGCTRAAAKYEIGTCGMPDLRRYSRTKTGQTRYWELVHMGAFVRVLKVAYKMLPSSRHACVWMHTNHLCHVVTCIWTASNPWQFVNCVPAPERHYRKQHTTGRVHERGWPTERYAVI